MMGSIDKMIDTILKPQNSAYVLGLASGFMIVMAWYFQYVLGLAPCVMCYWQRIPHWIVIGLSALTALGFILPAIRVIPPKIILPLMMAALIVGAGIAGWHSGVEYKIFPGPTACSGNMALDGDPSALLDKILTAPVVKCDEVSWSLFGLSMASWNGIVSLAMALFAGASIWPRSSKR